MLNYSTKLAFGISYFTGYFDIFSRERSSVHFKWVQSVVTLAPPQSFHHGQECDRGPHAPPQRGHWERSKWNRVDLYFEQNFWWSCFSDVSSEDVIVSIYIMLGIIVLTIWNRQCVVILLNKVEFIYLAYIYQHKIWRRL